MLIVQTFVFKSHFLNQICEKCTQRWTFRQSNLKVDKKLVDVQATEVRVEGLDCQGVISSTVCKEIQGDKIQVHLPAVLHLKTWMTANTHRGKTVGLRILRVRSVNVATELASEQKHARGNYCPLSCYSLNRLSTVIERPTSLSQSQQSYTAGAQTHD